MIIEERCFCGCCEDLRSRLKVAQDLNDHLIKQLTDIIAKSLTSTIHLDFDTPEKRDKFKRMRIDISECYTVPGISTRMKFLEI